MKEISKCINGKSLDVIVFTPSTINTDISANGLAMAVRMSVDVPAALKDALSYPSQNLGLLIDMVHAVISENQNAVSAGFAELGPSASTFSGAGMEDNRET